MKNLNLSSAVLASLLVLACSEAPATDDVSAPDTETSAENANETPDIAKVNAIDWGDDSGEFSEDGECDDMRFEGPGMTDTDLLDEDVKTDASDCRAAFEGRRLKLRE